MSTMQQAPSVQWRCENTQIESDCACLIHLETKTPIVLWNEGVKQAENNCACSALSSSLTPKAAILKGEYWHHPEELFQQSLPDQHTLLFNPYGMAGPVVLNELALALFMEYKQPKVLDQPVAQQLAELGLLQSVDTSHLIPDSPSTTLTAWLHVTNACNLRCTYCYVDKSDEAMDAATGLAAIDTLFASALRQGFQAIKLKYAGGEATLNFGLVKTLHEYAEQQAQATGLALEGAVLSNGVALSKAMLTFIREHNLRLMISLDGSEAEHDAQRTFVNGRGSYTHVMRSIDRALAAGVRPHLSITITGQSIDGIADAVKFALDRDLLFNLNFYRDHEATQDVNELRAGDERLIAAMFAAFAVIEAQLPRQSLIGALVDRSSFAGPHKHACGAGHDYVVVDHQGKLSRCQMEIERPVTDIFSAEPLAEIQLHTTGFQNLSVDEKEGCRDCQWRYWCAGGCSLLTYRVTGRNDVKSPYCNVYKAIYPELLRLEGLRLLKWRNN
ncbi:MAG TPA: SPASM domain-containing protein [Caldilineaceae bacterium]|nr:SPASM domain-containing protein [Caldilineaceae bacterium]